MYSLNKKFKMKKKYEYKDKDALSSLEGFMMPSRKKGFTIQGEVIKDIKVISFEMATPLVRSYVKTKYKKLIEMLTETILSDGDDSGEAYREALNHIEKFRLEIKNKYREYLLNEELALMAKQLGILQKEAKNQFMELQNSFRRTSGNVR